MCSLVRNSCVPCNPMVAATILKVTQGKYLWIVPAQSAQITVAMHALRNTINTCVI